MNVSQDAATDFSGLLAFTKILGMDPAEADKLCRDAVAETKNKSVHSYVPQYAAPFLHGVWTDNVSFIAIGRKPEAVPREHH
jgi:hypothetical protein